MEKDFELIEHTADVGIRAYGASISEAYTNTARAMFNLITDLDNIQEKTFRDVEVTAPDREILVVEWLNELIFLFDSEQLLFKRFAITKLTDTELRARCFGEKADRSRHDLKMGIKSATYHMLKVEQNDRYQVQVLLDI
jgi:SHS2 domain-containing protein